MDRRLQEPQRAASGSLVPVTRMALMRHSGVPLCAEDNSMNSRREHKNVLVSLHHWCESRNVHSCPPSSSTAVCLRSTPRGDTAALASETQAGLLTTETDLHSHQTPPVSVCLASGRVNTTLVEGPPFS